MGKKNYNNGVVVRRFEEGTQPEGWVLGMLPRSEEVKRRIAEKRRKTNLERYGVENPFQSEEKKLKIKETLIQTYGVEHPLQSEELKAKAKDTMLNKYGVKHALQSEELLNKARNTSIERHGGYALGSKKIKEKAKQTNLERYGVDNPMKDKKVQVKAKQSMLRKYGVEHALQSPEIEEKRRQTTINNYGVERPLQSEVIKERLRQTNLKNLGVPYPMMSKSIVEKRNNTNIIRYGGFAPLHSVGVKEKESNTCQVRYGYPWACMRPEARKYSNDSGPNKAFAKLLDENNISYVREFHIGSYSYDFKVGNTLIEVDPTWTHNALVNPFKRSGVKENYHQLKSQTAKNSGYHCIHIFDWDDVNKVVKLLQKGNNFIYARKCVIKDVDIDECSSYLVNNHLQGYCKGQEVCIGLYYNNELVSLMTFGKPRYNKNYEWELLRYCSSYQVIGGAEKLFKHFLKTYNPKSIISYCDNSKFIGKVYEKLGFTLKDEGSPSCHWYSEKEKRHITDNLLRQRGYDQLFNEHYGKGTSNEELIIQRGYLPVYDCGQSTWVYKV